jgi:hypothetical protein
MFSFPDFQMEIFQDGLALPVVAVEKILNRDHDNAFKVNTV